MQKKNNDGEYEDSNEGESYTRNSEVENSEEVKSYTVDFKEKDEYIHNKNNYIKTVETINEINQNYLLIKRLFIERAKNKLFKTHHLQGISGGIIRYLIRVIDNESKKHPDFIELREDLSKYCYGKSSRTVRDWKKKRLDLLNPNSTIWKQQLKKEHREEGYYTTNDLIIKLCSDSFTRNYNYKKNSVQKKC